ncbi:hypothetical protein EDD21DRAFT_392149 [Dissophora ornata]|nr:hypothetical protein EDD21DRAFT_392149 [Dissophora ornata]
MSINWVMLAPDGKDIVPLENETVFFREQGVRLELDSSNGGYPGAGSLYSSKKGTLMLTNQRVIYLCAAPTAFFSSASLPINNIQDGKLVQSWFSAPTFKAVITPVPGGGLSQAARLAITFSSGNIHDFDVQYRSLRERSHELDGAIPQHLEELPVYFQSSPTTTATVPGPGPTATTSAAIPQSQAPLYPPPPHVPPPTDTSNLPPPPPQPQQAAAEPFDLPPSYDAAR